MKYLDILASYVPSLVVSHLLDDLEGPVPTREAFRTVCLFCDVSGFTKLSEAMAQSGRGAEGLKTHLPPRPHPPSFASTARVVVAAPLRRIAAAREPRRRAPLPCLLPKPT